MPGNAAADLKGRTEPRLATEPARRLTKRTTLGYEAITFAEEVLAIELLPWQRWWLLHALELDSNGDFRFRVILTLVARQSGKTTLLKVVALWMMFMGRVRLVLGSAQSLDIARESWQGAVDLATDDPELAAEIASVRQTNGEQTLSLLNGSRYRISASTRSAGRGLSVDLLILDELREHHDWAAWSALSKTTMARPNALIVAISNAGDAESVVLNALRTTALAGQDPTLAIFEWSAPEGCELDDPRAWAAANPGLGYTVAESGIRSALATDPPAVFRTEVLCQRVDSLDGAVDMGAWRACADPGGSLEQAERVVLCLDAAPDGEHVTLVAATETGDGRCRVEVVAAWSSAENARTELPALVETIGPAALAWFPSGPVAVLAADLQALAGGPTKHEPVKLAGQDVLDACQEFAELVVSRRVVHADDQLLNGHVAGAKKWRQGDGWRFVRRGAGHVDAAYAAAGAVHTLRTMPATKPLPRPMVV